MKANELMIGDWVDFYHPYEPEKKIVTRHRVTEIFECGLVGICNHLNPVHADHIEPVEITPEILERNGFNREGGASYWHEGDRDACILHWSKDKEQLIIGSPCDDCMVQMNVRYIHELQHALRLCGIDKEITL